MQDPKARGRRMVLTVAAVFLLPLAAAFALYYGHLWRPPGSSNKGELIDPPRPLVATGLHHADGSPAGAEVFADKWSLVYVGDAACDRDCETALVYARQSRLALNNDMTRVQRVLIATAHCCDNPYFKEQQPGLVVLDAASAEAAKLLDQFPPERAKSLFIVDPLGNLMMRHDATIVTSKDLLTDLKKLLKLSHIG